MAAASTALQHISCPSPPPAPPPPVTAEINGAFFETDAGKKYISRIPPRRLGKLSELDGALLLLASDASSFMTGSELVVDGGHSNSAL